MLTHPESRTVGTVSRVRFFLNEAKCECDGHIHIHNNSEGGPYTGGPKCDSAKEGKTYCFTKPGACKDGVRSDTFPGHEWSYLACGHGGNLYH